MKELKKNLKFSWKYIEGNKKSVYIYLICNLIGVAISIIVPILSAKIIINLTDNALYQLMSIAVVIFLVEMFRNFVYYFQEKSGQIVYRESLNKLQIDLGKEILLLDNETLDKNGSGVFIQRLNNDTSKLADVYNYINYYVTNILTNIGIFVAIFIINIYVFLFLLVLTIVLYLVEHFRTKRYNVDDKVCRKKSERTISLIGEIVRGARDIKMLNSSSGFINELDKEIKDFNSSRYKLSSGTRKYNLIRGSVRDISDVIFIILIILLISSNNLEVASAIVLYNYAAKVPGLTFDIGKLLEFIKDYNLSCTRIFAILESKEFKKENFGIKNIGKAKGDFEFKNVEFSYGNKKVLNKVNFKVNANETVAFVGKSGSGKTTIFNLLCKMYDVKKGQITIDGVNINELDKESIRSNITIISQNPYIFNLSIKDNLKLCKNNLTKEEMITACKKASLHDFIMELPKKYNTVVGEGGVTLSGGQKQRLAIARALVQKTEIILFDEATSALDNHTQLEIQSAINNLKKDYTILIIAHRLSTIINSDRIIYLENGKVLAEGNHTTLLKKCTGYKKLYETEIKK